MRLIIETPGGVVMKFFRRTAFAFFSISILVPSASWAQDYPTKPVTFISPAAAGNSPDVITRIVAEKLSRLWNKQVVVLNRPGAGGMLALQAAAAADNDGYTLYMT